MLDPIDMVGMEMRNKKNINSIRKRSIIVNNRVDPLLIGAQRCPIVTSTIKYNRIKRTRCIIYIKTLNIECTMSDGVKNTF